jgi:N-formylglutamate deformylase
LSKPFYIEAGEGPIIAAAIHSGHEIREELEILFNLDDDERLREEDPYTDLMARALPSRILVNQSRFEVDMNREREKAVYLARDDAWGLDVWKDPLGSDVVSRSLAVYDVFYSEVRKYLSQIIGKYGYVVIYDLHTYNHRRGGPGSHPAAQRENPDVNLGTGNLNRDLWGPVIEKLAGELRSFDFPGGKLDVRENIKFRGGHFSRWIRKVFGDRSCAIAIEFKKIFMDEWTGEVNQAKFNAICDVLHGSLPGVLMQCREVSDKFTGVIK